MALIVNGQRIEDVVLDTEFSNIKAYYESLGNVSCCERDDEFRGYARQNIVARALLNQEAQRSVEPTPDEEVDAALKKLVDEYGGEGRFLSSFGATPEQMPLIRRDVETDLRVRRLIDRVAGGDEPAEAELRAYYETHMDAFKTAEEVRASHILKAPRRGEDRAAAYELLRQLRGELKAGGGKDFEALAKEHSDKRDEHIDLGFFKRGELAEEFEVVAFSLEVGEISPVFATPFGFHLVKLTDRKPSVPRPFEEVREEVRQRYAEERRQERTKELVKELESRATIEEVKDVPAGA